MNSAAALAAAARALPGAPGATLVFHHLGVAVADVETALAGYTGVLGYAVVAGPYDDPTQRARVCFVARPGAAEPVLELIAPLAPDAPVAKFVTKGIAGYHVCYEVPSVAATVAAMRAAGCIVVSEPVPAVAFGGRPIAWLFTPQRLLVELVEAPGAAAPDEPSLTEPSIASAAS